MQYPYRDPKTGQFAAATVAHLPNIEGLTLVTNSQDTHWIRQDLGEKAHAYTSFFVLVNEGEYRAVWGMDGVIPWTHKRLERIV